MVTRFFPYLIGFFVAGCGQSNAPTPAPVASTSASSVPAKPSVHRKTTPAAIRAADEEACLAGKKDACRKMADRYRGYGHPAGCGLQRDNVETAYASVVESMPVRTKRVFEDQGSDQKEFLVWIAKACDLGDDQACLMEKAVREGRLPRSIIDVEGLALSSDPQTSAFVGFKAAIDPENQEKFLEERRECLMKSRSRCLDLATRFLSRIKKDSPLELTPELMTKLQAIGERSLDYGALYMMLDKHGIPPEKLEPLKAHAAKTLVQACEEGACVCGEAAQSLPPDDPRVPDLARWGCENGEAVGCYALGKLHEEGRGVEKDEVFARSLYEIACPATKPSSETAVGEYSPAACGLLAEKAEGGANPPKNRDRAIYYAEYACLNPGYERDHSFCVKLTKYWTSGVFTDACTNWNADLCPTYAQVAKGIFYGPPTLPAEAKECERPSVKALCATLEPELLAMGKPPAKKKKK